jgi:hypothetical protein
MKIAKHITFFYREIRIKYINNIIEEVNKYKYTTDIFIHTNKIDLTIDFFNKYNNGNISIIYHDITDLYPFYLTWKCRDLLKDQRYDYDIFMYIEDDILVSSKTLDYWLTYNEKLIAFNYNLGFVRIELDNNIEYITDLHGDILDTIINIDGTYYCVNNKNPYCAFWIYNKNEFNRFIDSKYYDINNIPDYGIPERSGIGLNGCQNYWYNGTLIPIIGNKLIEDCKIYHMPNNFVIDNTNLFATIKFDEAIRPDVIPL